MSFNMGMWQIIIWIERADRVIKHIAEYMRNYNHQKIAFIFNHLSFNTSLCQRYVRHLIYKLYRFDCYSAFFFFSLLFFASAASAWGSSPKRVNIDLINPSGEVIRWSAVRLQLPLLFLYSDIIGSCFGNYKHLSKQSQNHHLPATRLFG